MNKKIRLYSLACLSAVALGSMMVMTGCQKSEDQSTMDAAPPTKADAKPPTPVLNKKGQGSMSAASASGPQTGTATATAPK